MATATLAASAGTLSRQSGASVSVGVPRIPNSDISPAEAPLRSPGSVALEIMKRFEGFVALPYNDQAGYCSIGYGHIVSLNRCEDTDLGLFAKGVSEEEAGRLLENDTELARRAIQELVTAKLTDDQFGALTSLVSNIGIQNFSKSTLLKSLNQGQYDLVPRQMLRWKSAAGRTLPLLAERRSCEAALFAGAPPVNDDGNLDPTKCLAYRDPDPPSDAEPPGDSAILPQ